VNRDPLIFLDVGAGDGVQAKWSPYLHDIRLVLVEPLQSHAAELSAKYPDATVLSHGLSNATGRFPLYVARGWGCTSLRQVNEEFVKRYTLHSLFDVIDITEVEVTRYDRLVEEGKAPAPDAMKIDVQGMEHEVLEGMGGALDNVLAIELEAHFYEVYRGQKRIGDIVGYLHERGFRLRRLEPASTYDGDVVECDAYFTRDRTPVNARKLDLVEQVWQLATTTETLAAQLAGLHAAAPELFRRPKCDPASRQLQASLPAPPAPGDSTPVDHTASIWRRLKDFRQRG
jgi:FkbM family methyltransferase